MNRLFPFSDEDKLDSDQLSSFVELWIVEWGLDDKVNMKMFCHIDSFFYNQDFWEINVVLCFKTIVYKSLQCQRTLKEKY